MLIIGLSGKKLSGKDTAYGCAQKIIRTHIRKLAFADGVYEEVANRCGVTEGFVRDNKKIFRPILQWWGTDFRRQLCDPNYWVEKVMDKIYKLPGDSIVFITDVRFLNEAEMVKGLNGILLRIDRKEILTGDQHPSEVDLDSYPFAHIINNDGTVKDLHVEMIKFLKKVNLSNRIAK